MAKTKRATKPPRKVWVVWQPAVGEMVHAASFSRLDRARTWVEGWRRTCEEQGITPKEIKIDGPYLLDERKR